MKYFEESIIFCTFDLYMGLNEPDICNLLITIQPYNKALSY